MRQHRSDLAFVVSICLPSEIGNFSDRCVIFQRIFAYILCDINFKEISDKRERDSWIMELSQIFPFVFCFST